MVNAHVRFNDHETWLSLVWCQDAHVFPDISPRVTLLKGWNPLWTITPDHKTQKYDADRWEGSKCARLSHSWRICEVGTLARARPRLASIDTWDFLEIPARDGWRSLHWLRCGGVLSSEALG